MISTLRATVAVSTAAGAGARQLVLLPRDALRHHAEDVRWHHARGLLDKHGPQILPEGGLPELARALQEQPYQPGPVRLPGVPSRRVGSTSPGHDA
jgi:hypothetical protein